MFDNLKGLASHQQRDSLVRGNPLGNLLSEAKSIYDLSDFETAMLVVAGLVGITLLAIGAMAGIVFALTAI